MQSSVTIAQMLSKNRETLPLLLDDPFVTCDDERLEKILDVLGKIANRTQILLFTCHRWQMYAIAEHFGYDVGAHALDVGELALLGITPPTFIRKLDQQDDLEFALKLDLYEIVPKVVKERGNLIVSSVSRET